MKTSPDLGPNHVSQDFATVVTATEELLLLGGLEFLCRIIPASAENGQMFATDDPPPVIARCPIDYLEWYTFVS